MQNCTYSSHADPKTSMDAKHLGYWSFRWSCESSDEGLRRFSSEALQSIPACRTASEKPFVLSLMLIALSGAAYWMFAAGLPAISSRVDTPTFTATLQALKAGRDDAILELRQPDGSPLRKMQHDFVSGLFTDLFQSLLGDFRSGQSNDPKSMNLTLSKTATAFISTLKRAYEVEMAPYEELALALYIDQLSVGMVTAAGETLRLNP